MIKRAHHQLTMKKFRCISFIGIAGVIITLMILNFANPGDESENSDDKNKTIKNKKKETNNQKKKVE